jgi:hypothetical protein
MIEAIGTAGKFLEGPSFSVEFVREVRRVTQRPGG